MKRKAVDRLICQSLLFSVLTAWMLLTSALQGGVMQFSGGRLPEGDGNGGKMLALYGFDRKHDWFRDKTNREILAFLKSWQVNAVFGASGDQALAKLLRNEGIRIYAEFGVFVGESYWGEIPGSRPVGPDGAKIPKLDWYAGLNPASSELRRRKLEEFREVLESGILDGIWLDFIRWPSRWEERNPQFLSTSFDRDTLSKFASDERIEGFPVDNPHQASRLIREKLREEWTSWRCTQVTSWVAEARRIVDEVAPETRLGLFAVPWIEEYDNAATTVMGQDFESLGEYIDVFSPMVYHVMCGQPVSWIGDVSEWFRETTGRDVIPIIQTVDQPETLKPDALTEAVTEALGFQGSRGVILFNLNGLNEAKRRAVDAALERDI